MRISAAAVKVSLKARLCGWMVGQSALSIRAYISGGGCCPETAVGWGKALRIHIETQINVPLSHFRPCRGLFPGFVAGHHGRLLAWNHHRHSLWFLGTAASNMKPDRKSTRLNSSHL